MGASVVFVTIIVPAVVAGSVFLHLRLAESLAWLGAVSVSVGVLTPFVLLTLRGALAPLRAWHEGDRSDPAAVWTALLRFPQQLAGRTLVIAFPFFTLTTYPWILAMADTDVQGAIALAVAYALVTATSALLVSTIQQMLFRPAVADVAVHLGTIATIERGVWSIRWRLVPVMFVMTSLAGVVLAAAVLGGMADSNDFLVAIVGGAIWAGYFSWLFDVGILRPTLRPLGEVIDATVRVRRGDVRTAVPVSSLDELGDLAAAFNEMQRGLAERESLHAAFGSYVDPALAQRLIESGSPMFDGEELVVTVLFADVRDFTSFSERVDPAEAVALLNRRFDVLVPTLHEHQGHANHYLGDGLLAVFGAPSPLDHHADAAVAASIEVQRRVRAVFGTELRLGIGINTGPVIAGTVGGGGRHEFTVIGDTVNVASRVEELTKLTGDAILITDATRIGLSTPRPRSTKRGAFNVRGKAAKVTVHAVNPFPRSTR